MDTVDAHELVKLLKGLDWLDATCQRGVLWFLDLLAREDIALSPDTSRMLATELERRLNLSVGGWVERAIV